MNSNNYSGFSGRNNLTANPKEEKLLADSKYQKKIVGAIANAVKRFFMN